MKRSRKKLSDTAKRRKRQREYLRKKREIKPAIYLRKKSPGDFIAGHTIEIIFAIIAFVIIAFFVKNILPNDSMRAVQETLTGIQTKQHDSLTAKYPGGYRLIAITEQKVLFSSPETFHPDIRIDWDNVGVEVIAGDPIQQIDPKVILMLNDINYPDANISKLNIRNSILRKTNSETALALLGKWVLKAKIVRDEGEAIYVLLGLTYRDN